MKKNVDTIFSIFTMDLFTSLYGSRLLTNDFKLITVNNVNIIAIIYGIFCSK